jgi:hypothetical protein
MGMQVSVGEGKMGFKEPLVDGERLSAAAALELAARSAHPIQLSG